MKTATGRTGRPPVTSRGQILNAARRIIDRDGSSKLTFRRLAAEIGVGTTTLYHHIGDREDLLVQLLNEHLDRTLRLDLPSDPRRRILAATCAIHGSLAAWPWAAEMLMLDGFLGRLGKPALAAVESIVAGAIDCGCTHEQAVGVFRSVWYYTVGEILVRSRSARHGSGAPKAGPTGGEPFFGDGLDALDFPALASLGDRWPELSSLDTYASRLEALVDGLLTQASSKRD